MNQTLKPPLSTDTADTVGSPQAAGPGAHAPRKERAYSESIIRHMGSIAQEARVSEDVAMRVSRALLAKIVERLTASDWPDDGHLVLSNVGRFEWRHWEPRHGYNPKTRKAIIIPAKKKLRFVVAKQFGDRQPLRPRKRLRKKAAVHAESQS